MEIIRGKQTSCLEASAWDALRSRYQHIHIDLGTGDGRYVRHIAAQRPDALVIGVDACRENLHDSSRRAPENALFVIANAQGLPPEFGSLADQITINFPWGSLLAGLLMPESTVLHQLQAAARPDALIDIHLNAGALAEAGWSLPEGAERVQAALATAGFRMRPFGSLTAHELRQFPTSWAKRLAFGRDPQALRLQGIRQTQIRRTAPMPQMLIG